MTDGGPNDSGAWWDNDQDQNHKGVDQEGLILVCAGSEDCVSSFLATQWIDKTYADVHVVCSDGAVVATHRLALAGLSALLEEALISCLLGQEEAPYVVLAPDVDADNLKFFLSGAYGGGEGEAFVSQDLRHLEFSGRMRKRDRKKKPPVIVDIKPEAQDLWSEELNSEDRLGEVDEDEVPLVRRRKRAAIWKYCVRLDNMTSHCAICGTKVRTGNGNTSNLIQHLRHNHKEEYAQWQEERRQEKQKAKVEFDEEKPESPKWSVKASGTKDGPAEEAPESWRPGKRQNQSVVWKFFRRLDELAMECIKCLKVITLSQGGTTSGCLNHLKRFHPEYADQKQEAKADEGDLKTEVEGEMDDYGDGNISWDAIEDDIGEDHYWDEGRSSHKGRRSAKKSIMWDHFRRISETHVSCNACGLTVPKRSDGPTTQCLRHIKRYHPERLETDSVPKKEGKEEETEGREVYFEDYDFKGAGGSRKSIIWSHFTQVDKKYASCNVCGKQFARTSGSSTSCLRHLKTAHPELLVQHADDQEFDAKEEIAENDSDELDTTEDALVTESRKKSIIWEHYTEISKTQVSCNECGKILTRTAGSSSSCLKHLKRFHPERMQQANETSDLAKHEKKEWDEVGYDDDSYNDGDDKYDCDSDMGSIARRRKKRSVVWSIFQEVDDTHLQCITCGHTLKKGAGGSTSHALLHVKNHHPEVLEQAKSGNDQNFAQVKEFDEPRDDNDIKNYDEYDEADVYGEEDDEEYEFDPPPTKRKKRKKTSVVWKFFKLTSENQLSCTLCDCSLHRSPSGSTTSALLHLKNHHSEQLSEVRGEEEEDQDESRGDEASAADTPAHYGRGKAVVWRYFGKVASTLATCQSCNAEIPTKSGNTSGLIQHLRHNHENLYEQWQEAKSNNETAEIEQPEEWTSDGPAWTWKEKRSIIYDFFQQINSFQMKCNKCEKLLIRSQGGSTSSCLNHLKRFHSEDLPPGYDSASSAPYVPMAERDDADMYFEKLCTDGQVKCKQCDEVFEIPTDSKDQYESMYAHIATKHKDLVGKVRRPKKNYYVRVRDRDGAENVPKRLNRSLVWDYFDRSEDGHMAACNKCTKVIEMKKQSTTSMRNHLRAHHKDEYQEFLAKELMRAQEMEAFTDSQEVQFDETGRAKKRYFTDEPEQRTCPDCHKVYSCRPAMLYHRKVVHSGIRPFKCDKCEQTFARVDCYRNHTDSCGKDGTEVSDAFLCSVCGKTFARRTVRNMHERTHHGERRYPCSSCDKKFKTKQQLDNHERTHTGEKPYVCQDCGRAFAQKHQLVTHLRIHTGESPYSCTYCGQRFRHLSTRNNHKCGRPNNDYLKGKSSEPSVTTLEEEAEQAARFLAVMK